MKILVASDSFKGTLSSRDIGRIIQDELSPFHQVDYLPVSDGGEGLLDAWQEVCPGRRMNCQSRDPFGREIMGEYILTDDRTAVIESAVAVGLNLLAEAERNPMKAGSSGLGMLISDALSNGAERIFIGLGGSAVNDGGVGLLRAMGMKLYDKGGEEIIEDGGGALSRISSMEATALRPWIQAATFYAVCDVDNPLLGPRGATRVYGPQKGADPVMVEVLEEGMAMMAEAVRRATGNDYTDTPGAGAAGGLGFCLKSFFDARLLKGIDALIDLTGLDSRISQYDLIITGEGKLDNQTESGKVPMGMLRLGEKYDIPVICLCGVNESAEEIGFNKVYCTVPRHASLAESITYPEFYLRKMIRDEVRPLRSDSFNQNRDVEMER